MKKRRLLVILSLIMATCMLLCFAACGEQAFYRCDEMVSVTIGEGATSIGIRAFGSCYSLEGVTIPSSVTEIKYAAFSRCSNLESVIFENPNGWSAMYREQAVQLDSAELSDSAKATEYLKETYSNYAWTRE